MQHKIMIRSLGIDIFDTDDLCRICSEHGPYVAHELAKARLISSLKFWIALGNMHTLYSSVLGRTLSAYYLRFESIPYAFKV